MDDPILTPNAVRRPDNRRLLIIIGAALLALLLVLAIWRMSGTNGARRDLAAANDKVQAKQKEVDDALRTYQQRVAELRALRANADAQATKLNGAIDQQVQTTVNDGRVDVPVDPAVAAAPGDPAVVAGGDDAAPVYYVRDRRGRFVPVTRR